MCDFTVQNAEKICQIKFRQLTKLRKFTESDSTDVAGCFKGALTRYSTCVNQVHDAQKKGLARIRTELKKSQKMKARLLEEAKKKLEKKERERKIAEKKKLEEKERDRKIAEEKKLEEKKLDEEAKI